MNKQKIIKKDLVTLVNLERSIKFAINSEKGRSYQLKVIHAAFKRTYEIMLKRRKYKIKQKKPIKIISSTNNPKHRFILSLLYELNLKPSEIIKLKVKDVENNFLRTKNSYKKIPQQILQTFEQYIKGKNSNDYLLQSNRNKHYSIRSIQEIRKKAQNMKKPKKTNSSKKDSPQSAPIIYKHLL